MSYVLHDRITYLQSPQYFSYFSAYAYLVISHSYVLMFGGYVYALCLSHLYVRMYVCMYLCMYLCVCIFEQTVYFNLLNCLLNYY